MVRECCPKKNEMFAGSSYLRFFTFRWWAAGPSSVPHRKEVGRSQTSKTWTLYVYSELKWNMSQKLVL
jgi:hypothetical protein